jgi:putative ABC transport system substrate-binding protein
VQRATAGGCLMRRRSFNALFGSAAVLPFAAHAQLPARAHRIAVLMLYSEQDVQGQVRATAFRQGIERAGWTVGRDLEVNYVWGSFDADWLRTVTAEIERWTPDIIVINSSVGLREIGAAAASKPIVFIGVSEPVARGFVASLSHPGGNMTGFSNVDPTFGTKWVELLKAVAPQVTRAAFLYSQGNPGSKVFLQATQNVGPSHSIDVIDSPVADLPGIEAAIKTLAREPSGALIIPPDPFTTGHRKRIVELATRFRLPVVSAIRSFADEGGLLSYGVHIPELFRQAALYVDRILRGDKPANMPVQQPTRFEMVINLKTAKALGLEIPSVVLAAADEIID